jgi:prevent-host-death family protein
MNAIQQDKKRKEIDVSDARKGFSDLVNSVAFAHDRVVLARNGKQVVAMISMEDLLFLEQLENEYDLRAARAASKGKPLTTKEAARKLGIT